MCNPGLSRDLVELSELLQAFEPLGGGQRQHAFDQIPIEVRILMWIGKVVGAEDDGLVLFHQ